MKLKNIFLAILTAGAMLCFGTVSCESPENEDISKPECKFNVDTVKFDAAGNLVSAGIDAVTLLATRDWTVSCDSSFVGIDPLSGEASSKAVKLDITVTKNTGYDRSATIKANAGNGLAKATLTVKQAGPKGDENESLLISVSEFIAKADGTNPYVLEGKVSGINTQHKWFNLTDATGTVQIYQPKNFANFEIEADGTAKVKGVYELYTNANTGVQTHEMKNCTILEYTGPDTSNFIFRETFGSSLGEFAESVKSGSLQSVWSYDAKYKCAKATAFVSSKSNASESWLISPAIDLTSETAATLTFDHASNYFTAVSKEVSVLVSKDGGDFVQVLVPTYPTSFTFVSSGDISLKDFLGSRIQVAVVYTSTATNAGTYELQNFVISRTDSGETRYPTVAECNTVAEILALEKENAFVLGTPVLVVAKTTGGVVVNVETGTVYVYGEGVADAKIGDKITFKAVRDEYNSLPELTAPEDVEIASSGNAVTYPEATDITGNFDAYTASTAEYISMTGILSTSQNAAGTVTYYNLAVPGATKAGSISLPLESFGLNDLVGKQLKVTGYYAGLSSSGYQGIVATVVEESDAPYLTVDKTAISVAASVTSATINVGGTASWTATSSDAVTIDPASGTGEGTVTVNFAENTDEENAKTYTVTIATELDAPVKSYDVVITQKKVSSGGGEQVSITFDFSNGRDKSGVSADWPTADNDGGEYTCTAVEGGEYTFVLGKNIYIGTATSAKYLMLKYVTALGLPVLDGKALVKVVATGSTGHSTSTRVGISSSSSSADYVTTTPDATYEVWSTTGEEHTYELEGEADKMYYIYVTNKNCQIAKLVLTYE